MDDGELHMVPGEAVPGEEHGHRAMFFSIAGTAISPLAEGWPDGWNVAHNQRSTKDWQDRKALYAGWHNGRAIRMIAAIFMFGPEHGKTQYMQAPLPKEVYVMEQPVNMFQQYREGEPFGPPRASMTTGRHMYKLHDVYDQDVEEGAIYFHHEDCCEKTYETSQDFKHNGPREQPKIGYADPMRRPSKKIRKPLDMGDLYTEVDSLGDPTRDIYEAPRMAGKSTAYLKAVEAMFELIKNEKKGEQ